MSIKIIAGISIENILGIYQFVSALKYSEMWTRPH